MEVRTFKKKKKLVEIRRAYFFKWDKFCRGVLLLGLDRPINKLDVCFKLAKSSKIVKGFAVGRSIFGKVAENWFSGKISNSDAIELMSKNFIKLVIFGTKKYSF